MRHLWFGLLVTTGYNFYHPVCGIPLCVVGAYSDTDRNSGFSECGLVHLLSVRASAFRGREACSWIRCGTGEQAQLEP
jgi:hypothetical protein